MLLPHTGAYSDRSIRRGVYDTLVSQLIAPIFFLKKHAPPVSNVTSDTGDETDPLRSKDLTPGPQVCGKVKP